MNAILQLVHINIEQYYSKILKISIMRFNFLQLYFYFFLVSGNLVTISLKIRDDQREPKKL